MLSEVDSLFEKGNGYLNSGNMDKAIEIYDEVLKLYPKHSGTLLNIAICWYYKMDLNLMKRMQIFCWNMQSFL